MRFSLLTAILVLLSQSPAAAQSIVGAGDSVNTRVRQNGRTYEIEGGTRSGDGLNLFHSFEQFGLDSGEIADFLSNPDIQNILGRVTGGDASRIDGLLRVSGSDANLFLLNPAGILFGENARLDVGGAFTATTATGIGFEDSWFSAMGDANYETLVGDPAAFDFAVATPGSIVNRGDLSVSPGESLTLIGGSAINTGTLAAPGGRLTIAAVDGDSRVRISQSGLLLSLDLETQAPVEDALPFTPLTLPELLTGGGGSASEAQVTETGEIRLSGSGVTVPGEAGTAIASGRLDASDASRSTAEINLVGDRVVVASARLDASGADGGTVRVGGGERGQGTIPNASETLVTADTTIRADALSEGDGGRVIVWSDGIATVDGILTARGGAIAGDGGFIETSGRTLNLTSTPNASAPNGIGGTWLIDPTNIDIVAGDSGTLSPASDGSATNAPESNQVGANTINSALNAGTSVIITTEIGGDEEGNITQNADAPIEKTAGGNSTITFEAANNIQLLGGITATGGALTVILNGDADGSGNGAVEIGSGPGIGDIVSNGGDIIVSGTNDSPANNSGIAVSVRGRLLSGGGDVAIAGLSTSNSESLFGAGFDRGINIGASADQLSGIETDGGAITLTGSSVSQAGIASFVPIASNSGDITLSGVTEVAGESPLTLFEAVDAGAGNLTVEADILPNLGVLAGTGALQLQSLTPDISVFNAVSQNLESIPDSFSSVGLGDPTTTAPIEIDGDLTFSSPLTLETQGDITFGIEADTITLDGPGLSAVSGGSIQVNASLNAQALSLDAGETGGDVVIDAPLVVVNSLEVIADNEINALQPLEITSAEDISFDAAVVNAEDLTLTAGNDVNLLGGMIIGDRITANAGNDITLDADLEASNLTFSANNDIILAEGVSLTLDAPVPEIDAPEIEAADVVLTADADGADGGDVTMDVAETISITGDRTLDISGDNVTLGYVDARDATVEVTTYGDGGIYTEVFSIEAADVTISANDTLTVEQISAIANSAVLQGGNVALSSVSGDVTVTDSIRTEADPFYGSDTTIGGGDVAITADEGSVDIGGSIVTFAREGGAEPDGIEVALLAGNITITSGEDVMIGGELSAFVNSTTPEEALPDSSGGNITITADRIQIDNADTDLLQASAIDASGTVDTSGEVGAGGAIALAGANGVQVNGDITTSNAAITLDGPATLNGDGAPVIVNNEDTTGAIAFGDTVEAADGLLVTAGTGEVTFGGAVGAETPLDSLTIESTGATQFNGDIVASSLETDAGGSTDLGANPTLTVDELFFGDALLGSGDFTLQTLSPGRTIALGTMAPVNPDESADLTLSDAAVAQFSQFSSLTVGQAEGGSDIGVFAPVTVGGPIAFDGGGLTIADGLMASSGDIALTGDQIDIGSEATLSGSGILTLQLNDINADIELGGAEGFLTQAELGAIAPGFTEIILGQVNSTGDVTLNSAARFSAPTVLTGGSTLFGPDQDTTFTITGGDQGRVSGLGSPVRFENFEAIAAGSEDDTVLNGSQFEGALDGGDGTDTFQAEAGGIIELGALPFENFEAILGNNSTLVGTADGDAFNVTATGTVDVQGFTISELTAIDGAAGADTFEIVPTAEIDSFIRGGAGIDEVSFAAFSGPLTLDLGVLDFDSIEVLTGSAGDDIIQFGAEDGSGFTALSGGPGNLDLVGGDLNLSEAALTTEGNLTLRGTGTVAVGDITSAGTNITIAGSSITAGNLDTSATDGPGGAIALQSNSTVTTGNLTTSGSAGGDLRIETILEITTGQIDTSGSVGSGGNVLLDPSGDIQVTSIDAQGGLEGVGGSIDVTTGRFFRATGQFTDQFGTQSSLSTAGGLGGGPIIIRHGGAGLIPFSIGNGGDLLNGTVAAITNGTATLAPAQSIQGSLTVDTIQILTDAQDTVAPLIQDPCPPNCETSNQAETEQLRAIAAEVTGPARVEMPVVVTVSTETNEISETTTQIEEEATAEFSNHLGLSNSFTPVSLEDLRVNLGEVQAQAGVAPAMLYVTFENSTNAGGASVSGSDRRLELILVTAEGDPLHLQIPDATQRKVQTVAAQLRRQVATPSRVGTTLYEAPAQQLYQWLIAPVRDELNARGIDTIGIITDAGLRSLPFAVLHDGNSFLIEHYALTLLPSASLTYLEYENLQQTDVLLGGASQFANQTPLPFVPIELNQIQETWGGDRFEGEDFTRKALASRVQQDYGIIHLATHGEFQPGSIENSYIQFSDGRLQVDDLQQLEWQPDEIRLVTLSACQTALGNREAELGFAGLAVSAGAQSALASLWSVSDAATTSLMIEFYQGLQGFSTKAHALRAAQLALIEGNLPIDESLLDESGANSLLFEPPLSDNQSFAHPFYWSAFTLVGSPW
ncbi:MAG: CHAT domain-containing protein [Elainellaceae cyanobacterium]